MESTALGDRVQSAMRFTRELRKSQADQFYADAEAARKAALAGQPDEFVDPTNVRDVARKILSEAPKRVVATQAGPVKEVMPQFLPSLQKIQELAGWNAPQTASEITRAISTVGEAIGRIQSGAADTFGGGFQLGDLKRIYGALNNDFDAALAKLDPVAQSKYKIARQFYKDNIEQFDQSPIIARTVNKPNDGGIANVGQISSGLAANRGSLPELLAIKSFLPAADYGALKAGILDSIRSSSTIPTAVGQVEDLTAFGAAFERLKPEFKREIMGSDKAVIALQETLNQFGAVKKATEELGQRKVASSEAMNSLIDDIRSGNVDAGKKKFGEAIAKDAARSMDYFNDITGEIRSKNLGKVNLDEGRFVDDFLMKSDDVNVVQSALKQLTPETANNVRRLVALKFFELAGDQENSSIAQLIKNEPELSSKKLIDLFIKDSGRREVLNALIPEQNKDLITAFLKYQRGIENAQKLGGDAGIVSAQAQFGGKMGGGVASFFPQLGESFIKLRVNRFIARGFFSKPAQEIMTIAAGGDFLSAAVAAWALAKFSPTARMPAITRADLMTLGAQFGAVKINEYLNSKREIDKRLAVMEPDALDAVLATMPEVATPLAIEGEPTPAAPVPDPTEEPPSPAKPAPTTTPRVDRRQRIEAARAKLKGTRERMTQ